MKTLLAKYRNYSWEFRRRLDWLYRRVESIVLEYDMRSVPVLENLDEVYENKTFHLRLGNAEQDLEDIVRSFPDELGFPTSATPEAVVREEVAGRFRVGIPCFVARDKDTDELLGAVWTPQWNFDGLIPVEKRSLKANAIVNLYVIPTAQGLGIATCLLRYATSHARIKGCEYFFSLVTPERIPSLRSHLKVGFTIIGTGFHGSLFGKKIEKQKYGIRLKPGVIPIVPVVIVTTIHHDGSTLLSTIRALGRSGIPVYLLAKGPLTYVGKTRYAQNIEQLPDNASDEELIRMLNETLAKIGHQIYKPVLMHVSENDIYRLHSLKAFLDEYFTVVPSEGAFDLLEKSAQLPLAAKAGFRVPQSMLLQHIDDLAIVGKKLRFPVIVKPLARHTSGSFKDKALVFESEEKLTAQIRGCFCNKHTQLIVQEYIPGDDANVLVFMASCGEKGETRAFVGGRKLRQYPPGMGMMASGIVERNDEMEELSKMLCRNLNVRGFIGIEAKKHPDTEELYYIETSFRPEAFNSLAEIAGTNLVLDAYLTAIGQPCLTPKPRQYASYLNLQYEIDAVRKLVHAGKAKWRDLFRPLPRPTAYSLYAFDDPLPFLRWFLGAALMKILRCVGLR